MPKTDSEPILQINAEFLKKINPELLKDINSSDCNCPKIKCKRHAICIECIEHHAKRGRLPRCKKE